MLASPARAAEIRVASAAGAAHAVTVVGAPAEVRSGWAGLDAPALGRRLQVFTGDAPGPDQPTVAGAVRATETGLEFRPLFPFVSGLRYTAVYAGDPPLRLTFEAEPPGGPVPRVVSVFPSGGRLPENTLRLYLAFSQPMEPRDVERHVHLLDDAGRELELAFVEIPHGLWDAARTRLTLIVHPGRLKRGIAPGERLGAPLRAGRSYALRVDAGLRDATGRSLGLDFEHRFEAVAADRSSPRPEGVMLAAPGSPTAPLVVDLPEALDEGLLHRLLWVEAADGEAVPGRLTIDREERRWTFAPERPWAPGAYALRLHPALEDRAGNRFDRLFDRELAAAAPEPARELALRFGFEVGPCRLPSAGGRGPRAPWPGSPRA